MNNNIQPNNRGGGMSVRSIIAILAGLYTFSPIDAMPDFIPVAGQVDDIGVVILAVAAILVATVIKSGSQRGGN